MCWRGDARDGHEKLARIRWEMRTHVEEIDRAVATDAELAIGELLSNVVRHAPGPFCAEIECRDGSVILHVHDVGNCFDVPEGGRCDPATAERGRGFAILRAIGASVRIALGAPRGCRVSVALPATCRTPPSLQTCPHNHPGSRNEYCPRLTGISGGAGG